MANKFKGNTLIYIPATKALSDTRKKYPFNNEITTHKRQLSWWSNDPLFSYNAMLVSAYYGIGRLKDRSEIRDDVLLFGDSGGYQIYKYLSRKLKDQNIFQKLTWKKVIEWQMNVCDVGMTLDIPTPREWDQIKDRKIFEKRLKLTTGNALEMLKHKDKNINDATTQNKNFKLFNCIQGSFYEDMERWYDVTTDHHNCEYDGFSFSNSNMRYILALRLGFAIEHSKGKPFHILGTSSPQSLALVAYANKYTDTQIYFDSSSAATGQRHRKFMIYWDFL